MSSGYLPGTAVATSAFQLCCRLLCIGGGWDLSAHTCRFCSVFKTPPGFISPFWFYLSFKEQFPFVFKHLKAFFCIHLSQYSAQPIFFSLKVYSSCYRTSMFGPPWEGSHLEKWVTVYFQIFKWWVCDFFFFFPFEFLKPLVREDEFQPWLKRSNHVAKQSKQFKLGPEKVWPVWKFVLYFFPFF